MDSKESAESSGKQSICAFEIPNLSNPDVATCCPLEHMKHIDSLTCRMNDLSLSNSNHCRGSQTDSCIPYSFGPAVPSLMLSDSDASHNKYSDISDSSSCDITDYEFVALPAELELLPATPAVDYSVSIDEDIDFPPFPKLKRPQNRRPRCVYAINPKDMQTVC